MAGSKKHCATCGNGFIGRASASYCSPACRQRAHRGRVSSSRNAAPAATVTVFAGSGGRSAHSAEALALLRELDDEQAEASAQCGQELVWSAQEQAIRGQLASVLDRKVELLELYESAETVNLKVKLSGEVRLLEQAVARLVCQIKVGLPAPESFRTVKARQAANVRWGRSPDVAG
jgi:hypothetical protein